MVEEPDSARPTPLVRESAKLVWATKPRRAPNPRDLEFQTAEIVLPNAARDEQQLLGLNKSPLDSAIDTTLMNRVIWGDNLLIMQALLAQGYEGKIRLVYIDPPFASSEDYHYVRQIADESVTKTPSTIERLAYKDTWSRGIDSYLEMLFPRLQLMRRLLSEDGSIYVHIGPEVSHYVRLVLDEVFGRENFLNEITWKRFNFHADARRFGRITDHILFYSKSDEYLFNRQYADFRDEYIASHFANKDANGRSFALSDLNPPGGRGPIYEFHGITRPWRFKRERMAELEASGHIYVPTDGTPRLKRFLDEQDGAAIPDIWTDIPPINSQSNERIGYPTQKPIKLLERIIETSSHPGDIVADFFVGSGTTAIAAEQLERRWLVSDFSKVALQVARSRLVEADCKPFVIENIGNYQRELIYLGGARINEMQRVIHKLYGSTPRDQQPELGVRTESGESTLVFVGYPDRPVSAHKVADLTLLAPMLDGAGYKTLVVLAWDYELNYSELLNTREKAQGGFPVRVESRVIPPEVYDHLKRVKEEDLDSLTGKVVFHEKPYLRLGKLYVIDRGSDEEVTVRLDQYVVFEYPVASEEERARLRDLAAANFLALIDYWAVDWDYDGRTFRSRQQSFRGFGTGARERTAVVHATLSATLDKQARRVIAVRVVDAFGNDASALIEFKR